MYQIRLGTKNFRYWVGTHTVGIITSHRKKVIVSIPDIESDPSTRTVNGTADGRVSADEVAAYIMQPQFKHLFFPK